MRVFRLIEYVGPEEWIEATLARSIQGEMKCNPDGSKRIQGTTLPADRDAAIAVVTKSIEAKE